MAWRSVESHQNISDKSGKKEKKSPKITVGPNFFPKYHIGHTDTYDFSAKILVIYHNICILVTDRMGSS